MINSSNSLEKSASSSTVDSSNGDAQFDGSVDNNGASNGCYNNNSSFLTESSQNGLTGLQNLGNTCYLNSALQALSNCPPLTNYFQTCGAVTCRFVERRQSVARCFAQLIEDIWSNQRRAVVDPSNLAATFRSAYPAFRLHTQQDAQEFLRCFLDRLHEELSEPVVCFLDSPDTTDSGVVLSSANTSIENTSHSRSYNHHSGANSSTTHSDCSYNNTGRSSCSNNNNNNNNNRSGDNNNFHYDKRNNNSNYDEVVHMTSSLMTSSQLTTCSDCSSNNDVYSVPLSHNSASLSSLTRADTAVAIVKTDDSDKFVKVFNSDVSTDYETADDEDDEANNNQNSNNNNHTNNGDFVIVSRSVPGGGQESSLPPPDLIPVQSFEEQCVSSGDNQQQQQQQRKRRQVQQHEQQRHHQKQWQHPLSTSTPPHLFRRLTSTSDAGLSTPHQRSPQHEHVPTRSIISDLFDGQIRSCVKCLTCGNVSTTKERFQDLSLPIPGYNDLQALRRASGTGGSHWRLQQQHQNNPNNPNSWVSWVRSWLPFGSYRGSDVTPSVNDCLSAFFVADELTGDDMYSCSHCDKLRNGVRYAELLSLPEILCIHLKRFRHDMNNGVSKIKQHVTFPLTDLDLAPFKVTTPAGSDGNSEIGEQMPKDSGTTLYDLVAIVQHEGNPLAGHYTAFCRHDPTGLWYEYDDDCCTQKSLEEVMKTQAYVLFYRRRPAPSTGVFMRQLASLVKSSDPKLSRTLLLSAKWRETISFLYNKASSSPMSHSRRHRLAKRARSATYNDNSHHNNSNSNKRVTVKRRESLSWLKPSSGDLEVFTPASPLLVFYISKKWLCRVQSFSVPGPISNYDFLCEHGAVQPRCFPYVAELVEPIPEPAWQLLFETFGGGPACNKLYECHWCRTEAENLRARQIRELETYRRLENAPNSPTSHENNSSSAGDFNSSRTHADQQYAIAMGWWRRWRSFVSCRSDLGAAPSALQTNSCGMVLPPGPIDNMSIAVAASPVGNSCNNDSSNNGDNSMNNGGSTTVYQLRHGKIDYARLNEATWRYLHGVYGGGPELPLSS